MRNLIIGIAIGLSLVVSYAAAQDAETGDGDESNLALVELGNVVFALDAQEPEVGCSVEVLE
jgi:hypothetical protein